MRTGPQQQQQQRHHTASFAQPQHGSSPSSSFASPHFHSLSNDNMFQGNGFSPFSQQPQAQPQAQHQHDVYAFPMHHVDTNNSAAASLQALPQQVHSVHVPQPQPHHAGFNPLQQLQQMSMQQHANMVNALQQQQQNPMSMVIQAAQQPYLGMQQQENAQNQRFCSQSVEEKVFMPVVDNEGNQRVEVAHFVHTVTSVQYTMDVEPAAQPNFVHHRQVTHVQSNSNEEAGDAAHSLITPGQTYPLQPTMAHEVTPNHPHHIPNHLNNNVSHHNLQQQQHPQHQQQGSGMGQEASISNMSTPPSDAARFSVPVVPMTTTTNPTDAWNQLNYMRSHMLNMHQQAINQMQAVQAMHHHQLEQQFLAQASEHEYRGPPPASRDVVNRLPQAVLDDIDIAKMDGSMCIVCQDDMQCGEKALQMPCSHTFHSDCILPWLAEHNSCPTCRHELPVEQSQ